MRALLIMAAGLLASSAVMAVETAGKIDTAGAQHAEILAPSEYRQVFGTEYVPGVAVLSRLEMTETVGGPRCMYFMSSEGTYQKYCPSHAP